jgi:hypothetical protein
LYALALPLLVPRIDAFVDFFNDDNAILYEPGSKADLHVALDTLLDDREYNRRFVATPFSPLVYGDALEAYTALSPTTAAAAAAMTMKRAIGDSGSFRAVTDADVVVGDDVADAAARAVIGAQLAAEVIDVLDSDKKHQQNDDDDDDDDGGVAAARTCGRAGRPIVMRSVRRRGGSGGGDNGDHCVAPSQRDQRRVAFNS